MFARVLRRSSTVSGMALPAAVAILWAFCTPASAQFPNLAGGEKGKTKQASLRVESTLLAERLEPGAVARLAVKVTIPQGFYLYAMDPSFSRPSKIVLEKTPGLEPVGEFQPDRAPKETFDESFQRTVKKFSTEVVWSRPMRVVDPSVAAVQGEFSGLYCSTGPGGMCRPASESIDVKLAQGAVQSGSDQVRYEVVNTPEVRGDPGPATVRISLSPKSAAVGEKVTLSATMTLEQGWHTYSVTQPSVPGAQASEITLDAAQGLTPIGERFVPDSAPKEVTLDGPEGKSVLEEHFGTVTWSHEFRVDESKYGIEGSLRYVTCKESLCLQPKTISFALGHVENAGEVPAAISGGSESSAALFSLENADTVNLPYYLTFAFLGGFILNFMPCVLPVVAIKVMGFVQHAGQRRGHIFALNGSYAAGVISVFLLLATLAALPQLLVAFSQVLDSLLTINLLETLGIPEGPLKWGGLFQSPAFTTGMAALVFVMGLSLLGVYEIPIPGMVGSAAGSTRQEGLAGAFLMGIFTTLLATPCTGPFLTSTLGWSLQQPVLITYAIWGMMGLGMASPYLVFGLVPGAVKLLPRPGNWMVHLKQFAGFVLMGTVLWLLHGLQGDYLIPLLVALLGLAVGCWMFGMVQYSTTPGKRWVVSVAALAISGAVAIFAYDMTQKSEHRLAWKPFSTERVNELIADRKTVLIDFTADWCANCKINEKFALNTKETQTLVKEHDVVPLVADFTQESAEIQQWLDRFNAVGIPLTVIFPADNPDEPIVLDGLYSQSTLTEKLKQAVENSTEPSTAAVRATARR